MAECTGNDKVSRPVRDSRAAAYPRGGRHATRISAINPGACIT